MRAGHIYLLIAIVLMAISLLKDKQRTKEVIKATFKTFYVVMTVFPLLRSFKG